MSSDDICSHDFVDNEICGDKDKEEKEKTAEMELKATWLGLSPPVVESSIMGKWYAGIYKMKK